ncbi:hypothetical protein [Microvirga sp. P5_D2]
MSRTTLNRLAKLEAFVSHRGGLVHVIPAHSDEEFRERQAAFIDRASANASDTFMRVHGHGVDEPFATGKTMTDLLAHIAMIGRRVHDHGRNAQ